jgi:hypothetical protein
MGGLKMKEDLSDYMEGVGGAAKHFLSRAPVVGEAIAGYEGYKRAKFDRQVCSFRTYIEQKIEDIGALFSGDWLQTEDGQQFVRKVIDSALDAQMEDKQELFVNALINGIQNAEISQLEKLKFVDILRHLSCAALMVLADMHNMFKDKVRGPGRTPQGNPPYPCVEPSAIATSLAGKYDPYLVVACIHEMESEGLFSNIAEWREDKPGSGIVPQGFDQGLSYNHFTARFVEFVTLRQGQGVREKS